MSTMTTEERLEALEKRVKELEHDLEDALTRIDDLESGRNFDDLPDDLATLESRVDDLELTIDELENSQP